MQQQLVQIICLLDKKWPGIDEVNSVHHNNYNTVPAENEALFKSEMPDMNIIRNTFKLTDKEQWQ